MCAYELATHLHCSQSKFSNTFYFKRVMRNDYQSTYCDTLLSWVPGSDREFDIETELSSFYSQFKVTQWTIDLSDTDIVEAIGLTNTSQKILVPSFDVQCIKSLLEIAENIILVDKRAVTDFSAESSFHCNMYMPIFFYSFLK